MTSMFNSIINGLMNIIKDADKTEFLVWCGVGVACYWTLYLVYKSAFS